MELQHEFQDPNIQEYITAIRDKAEDTTHAHFNWLTQLFPDYNFDIPNSEDRLNLEEWMA